jgi:surfactin synthase thioesterase subunit
MNADERKCNRLIARREFYADLRESSDVTLETASELQDDNSNSNPTSSTTRSSIIVTPITKSTNKTFTAFSVNLAESKDKVIVTNEEEIFIPYIKSDKFNPHKWIHALNNPERRAAICICIHGIGGTHENFSNWTSLFTESDILLLAVCLPGRMDRVLEPPVVSVQDAARGICDALEELKLLRYEDDATHILNTPLLLFGHSLGALVAYEVVKVLISSHPSLLSQLHVFISCCPNPISLTVANRDPFGSQYSKLSEKELYMFLVSEGYISTTIIRRVSGIFIPLFRKDFELYQSYYVRTSDEYARVSLGSIPIMCIETKTYQLHEKDVSKDLDEDNMIINESKLSQDYLTSVYPHFQYTWHGISENVHETDYVRVSSNQPLYFTHSSQLPQLMIDYYHSVALIRKSIC